MVTGRGESLSAQNNPASPPPTITTSSTPPKDRGDNVSVAIFIASAPLSCSDHLRACHGSARSCGDLRVDDDLLLEIDEAVENLRQGDPLHVWAKIARTHKLDLGQF